MFKKENLQRTLFQVMLLLALTGLSLIAVLYPLSTSLARPKLEAGQVAQQDILAPRTTSYESDILTEQQKDAAARLTAPVYTSPDTSVARQQASRLRDVLAYVSSVRADTHSSLEQKLSDLSALEDIQLRQETAQKVLALTDARWQTVQQEEISVLEQVMRNNIREDRLEEARRSVPTRVSLSLPEEQAAIVAELATAFVAPNSFYSEELTEQARQQAREAIQPVTRSFVAQEAIIQRGRVVTALDIEALEHLGLIEAGDLWQQQAGAAGMVLIAFLLSALYLSQRSKIVQEPRSLLLTGVLFIIFLVTARWVIPGHTVLPYLFPLSAFSLTIAALFGVEAALISIIPLALLVTYGLPNALDLTLFYITSALFGVLSLGQGRRILAFLGASTASALAGAITVIAYRLAATDTDLIGLATLAGASAFNGLTSAGITVLLQFFLAQFVGMTTALQLMELSRPDHPLLQFILRRAPGTYQHSLQVANLAEQAAERIEADALLTRIGALYHDAGKAINPAFFIENQIAGGINPHDDLDPAASAAIIIRHVPDGLELARKYRVPQRIRDFISEHHGDSMTQYQYVKAVEAANGNEAAIGIQNFKYPGPRPRSRETAILMLADGSEAVTRAKNPRNEEDLRELIQDVVDKRLKEGQLDETDLTLRELSEIVESFTATLKGVYHPRIEYPNLQKRGEPQTARPPDAPTVPADSALHTPTVPNPGNAQRQAEEAS